MNHIHELQATVRALKAERITLHEGLTELAVYLTSSKFSCGSDLDGYVNVQDVLNRIANAKRQANDTLAEYTDIYHKIEV